MRLTSLVASTDESPPVGSRALYLSHILRILATGCSCDRSQAPEDVERGERGQCSCACETRSRWMVSVAIERGTSLQRGGRESEREGRGGGEGSVK